MQVSHSDSETRKGFTATFSERYAAVSNILRQSLSPLDFAFCQQVGLQLFKAREPEYVILAGMAAAVLDRADDILKVLEPHERRLAEDTFAVFTDPAAHSVKSAPEARIVSVIVHTWLTDPEIGYADDSHAALKGTAESLIRIREQLNCQIPCDSLDKPIREWCRLHGVDPLWVWSARPVYVIQPRAEVCLDNGSSYNAYSAMQTVRRLIALAGFFFMTTGKCLLVRATAKHQTLLDRLAVSIAAHEPYLTVNVAEDFPTDAGAWQVRRLTIDEKLAVYRRNALLKTTALDPYPPMLTIIGK